MLTRFSTGNGRVAPPGVPWIDRKPYGFSIDQFAYNDLFAYSLVVFPCFSVFR